MPTIEIDDNTITTTSDLVELAESLADYAHGKYLLYDGPKEPAKYIAIVPVDIMEADRQHRVILHGKSREITKELYSFRETETLTVRPWLFLTISSNELVMLSSDDPREEHGNIDEDGAMWLAVQHSYKSSPQREQLINVITASLIKQNAKRRKH